MNCANYSLYEPVLWELDCYTFDKYTKDQSAPFDAAMFVDTGGLGPGSYESLLRFFGRAACLDQCRQPFNDR